MGFRTLEISRAAEIHIKEGQLEITTEDGVAVVPIEDLNQIMVHGANIRLSTRDLSILSQNKVATGFHPTFGIHHDNQLNAFNLADDLIEPYRAIVDLVAHNNIASNIQLTKAERRELAHILHNACSVDGVKVNVMSAIDIMVESLKRIILDASTEKLKLPIILPIESMEGITE